MTIGDVNIDADHTLGASICRSDYASFRRQPQHFTVRSDNAEFVVVILAMIEYVVGFSSRAFAVFRVNKGRESVHGGLAVSGFETQELPDHFGPYRFAGRDIPFPGADPGRFLRAAQTALALTQRVRRLLSFGN